MTRVEFRLTMPNPPSWNGKWSGDDRKHAVVRTLKDDVAKRVLAGESYDHHFGDGWVAHIEVRQMAPCERKGKSAGFSGYEWMIDNIVAHGSASPKRIEVL
jgi:hypothetical protein